MSKAPTTSSASAVTVNFGHPSVVHTAKSTATSRIAMPMRSANAPTTELSRGSDKTEAFPSVRMGGGRDYSTPAASSRLARADANSVQQSQSVALPRFDTGAAFIPFLVTTL